MGTDKKRKMLESGLLVFFSVCAGKVLGFLKQSILAWAFGANEITDVYFTADGYISMFSQILGASIAPAILTQYIKLENSKNLRSKSVIESGFIFFALIAMLVVSVNAVFSGAISRCLGLSYSADQLGELSFFIIALSPVIVFSSLTSVSQGYLEANQKFVPSKLASLFYSISIMVVTICLHRCIGIYSLLFGFLLGYVLHTAFMLYMVRNVLPRRFSNPLKNPDFVAVIKKISPLVLGNSVVDLGQLVDKIIASALASGSVSVLYYGQIISYDLVNATIITTVGAILLPSLTRNAENSSQEKIKSEISKILLVMLWIIGAVVALYFVEGSDLVNIAFQRGNFDQNASEQVSKIAIAYALGFVFMAIREVMTKAHYAFHDTTTPMINSVIGVVCNLLGNIILSRHFGVVGIAASTTISMGIISILSTCTLSKHIGRNPISNNTLAELARNIILVIIASSAGMILHYYVLSNLPRIMRLVVNSVAIGGMYVCGSFVFKMAGLKEIVRIIK